MATNAPYFQLRGHGQFTSGTNTQFAPDVVDSYGLAASLAPQHAPLYSDSQTTQDAQPNALEDSHNFVELLEAATTAAGQAAGGPMNADGGGDGPGAGAGTTDQSRGKRKRVSSSPVGDASATPEPKRARIDVATDPLLHGPDSRPPSDALLNDARAAGVHSAAALFRRSSKEPTRKYTRPPMSKLFISLQLSPENFLHLQAQAKSYMLDPAHPERQSCVGNRGKGDTDMVKLRLFNCVRDFLNDGVGERFFGEHVEKPAEEEAVEAARALGEEKASTEGKLVWPGNANKIISLVTPLLRRMVTNERQRQYAIETRRGGKKKEDSAEASPAQENHEMETDRHEVQGIQTAFHDNHQHSHSHNLDQHSTLMASAPSLPSFTTHHFTTLPGVPEHQSPSLAEFDTQENIALSNMTGRALPTAADRAFELRKIRVFLTKNGLKLKTRLGIVGPGPLVDYTLVQLQGRIVSAIKGALITYPQLRPDALRSTTEHELRERIKGMAPEALRGLAAAATEIHDGNVHANGLDADLRIDSVNDSAPDSSTVVPTAGPSPNDPSSQFMPSEYLVPKRTDSENASTCALAPDSNSPSPTERPSLEQQSHQQQTASASQSKPLPPIPSPTERQSLEQQSDQQQTASASQSKPFPPAMPRPPPVVSYPHLEGLERLYPNLGVLPNSTVELLPGPGSASLRSFSLGFPEPGVPKYLIKAMVTTGLVEIKDELDWKIAKDDVGYSVWADGKLTIVVELV